MLDIPIGKALVPEIDCSYKICDGCFFEDSMKEWDYDKYLSVCKTLACNAENRKDGKNVIFKLIDYPVKGNQ